MTVTEAPPTAPVTATTPVESAWLYDIVTSTDHKVVGRLFMGFASLFLVVAAVVGAVVGIEGMDIDDLDLFETVDSVTQAATLSQFSLAFLVVVPFFLGLGLAIAPLQVGSPAGAFPRAAAASFWGWLIGAGLVIGSWAGDGGLGGSVEGTNSDAVALSLAGLILVSIALGLGSICLATTVLALRAPGMSLHRVPLLSWTGLVSSVLLVFSLPILVADLLLAYVDLRGRPPIAYGIESSIYGEVSWAVSAPQVFLYALPVLGVIGDIIPALTRTRPKMYPVLLGAAAFFGVLGFGAFARVAFEAPGAQDSTHELLYLAMGLAVILPVVASLGGWLDSLRVGGRALRPSAPLIGTIGALLLILLAAASSTVRAFEPFELVGTAADAGVAQAALWASVAGAIAALAFWGPKLTGRQLPVPAAGLVVLLLLLGTLLVTAAPIAAGFVKDTEEYGDLLDTLRVLSGIGSVVLALAALLAFMTFLLVTFGRGEASGSDPWGGHTLEWATSSPPPLGNFVAPVATVRSERPLLDEEEAV